MRSQSSEVSPVNRVAATNVWLKSVIQAIPYVGSLLDNMLSRDYLEAQQKRLQEFFDVIEKILSSLEGQHPIAQWLNTEEGYFAFVNILDKVRREYHRSKVVYYGNIFSSYAFFRGHKNKPAPFLPERYIAMIERYSPMHFDILKDIEEYFSDPTGGTEGFFDVYGKKMPFDVLCTIITDFVDDHLLLVEKKEPKLPFMPCNVGAFVEGPLYQNFVDHAVFNFTDRSGIGPAKAPNNGLHADANKAPRP